MKVLFYILAISFFTATFLPLLRHDGWWVRIFEFPRFQITILGIIIFIYALFIFEKSTIFIFFFLIVFICLVFQIIKMIPYTRIHPVQMLQDKNSAKNESIKLMITNVLMQNKNIDGLVNLISSYTPDILLVIEADEIWYKQLTKKISYEYIVSKPLNNTYGMVLYSNLELENSHIEYLVENEVPSIHTKIIHPSNKKIILHCLHPKPPAPQESTDTTERDAELLIVGKLAKQHTDATIVAGDLNDVAWSYTTTLFQKTSGLLDPRIGRGMFNTFHAKIPFFRFPLDHAFASKHFLLKSIKRLPTFGSDHFPILIELSFDKDAPNKQVAPSADREDKQKANEKIREGIT